MSRVANPFYKIIKTGALSGPTVPAYQLQLPYPQFTGFSVDSLPVANSIYHSLQLRAEKRLSKGLQFLVTYTFSKSIDDSSGQGLTVGWLRVDSAACRIPIIAAWSAACPSLMPRTC